MKIVDFRRCVKLQMKTPNGSIRLADRHTPQAKLARKLRRARWELKTADKRLATCPPEKLEWLRGRIEAAAVSIVKIRFRVH